MKHLAEFAILNNIYMKVIYAYCRKLGKYTEVQRKNTYLTTVNIFISFLFSSVYKDLCSFPHFLL